MNKKKGQEGTVVFKRNETCIRTKVYGSYETNLCTWKPVLHGAVQNISPGSHGIDKTLYHRLFERDSF